MLSDASEGVKHASAIGGCTAMAGTLHCPECGEEYVSSATRCVECGVGLVSEAGIQAAIVAELPPAAELACLRTGPLSFIQGLSAQLAQAGLSHRIEVSPEEPSQDESKGIALRRPGTLPYGIYVRHADVAAGLEIDRDYMRQMIPDLAHAPEPAGDEACPACGTPLVPDAAECSDCGLSLAADA
jgi:hypothetical protein